MHQIHVHQNNANKYLILIEIIFTKLAQMNNIVKFSSIPQYMYYKHWGTYDTCKS